ncbi:hypothetical protein EU527_09070 [Candidatus Thorarchaeota archaeon]|nr:MAG: hypothetical protein EU527_09070 [Candidatus Thorarchaeota archaeon]
MIVVKIFLTIKVEPNYTETILSQLKSFKEVSQICLIDRGCYDIIAIINVESFEEYRIFSIDTLAKLSHLEDYTSFITLGV